MKTFLGLLLLFLSIHLPGQARNNDLRILIGGNAYVTASQDGAKITDNGILNWTDPSSVISIFFYVGEAGSFDLSVFGKGHSRIKVSCNGQNRPITLNSDYYTAIPAGTFQSVHRAMCASICKALAKKKPVSVLSGNSLFQN